MATEAVLSVQNAWNSVALEERLELVSRAKAQGTAAGVCFVLMAGSIGYGFDKIEFLFGGILASLFVGQLFSFHSWRSNKPEAILKYLAARSVARRYAYGYRMPDLDVVLIFRGHYEQIFSDQELEQLYESTKTVDFNTKISSKKPVWICLMRGAVVVMSERRGGAKLEFICPVQAEAVLRKPNADEEVSEDALVLEGCGPTKGRIAAISSTYPGAFYVFEKQLERLLAEARRKVVALERI